jgi:hypothetical protein
LGAIVIGIAGFPEFGKSKTLTQIKMDFENWSFGEIGYDKEW